MDLHKGATSKRPVPEAELRAWGACLLDPKSTLVERSRALWGLRHAMEPLAIELIAAFLCDVVPPSSVANALLQHEAAYCLGQRGDAEAVPYLVTVMRDSRHPPVVRHEAAEALAALCEFPGVDVELVESVLAEFACCDVVELAETCQLGLGRLTWLRQQVGRQPRCEIAKQVFPDTVDPAPGLELSSSVDGATLRDIMMDPAKSLFTRYRALFSLRDCILEARLNPSSGIASADSLAVLLAQGLKAPGSALFRHEVAFVLGQLGMKVTVPDLADCLQSTSEHAMVRHEAAEALGAVIGQIEAEDESTKSEESITFALAARCVLKQFLIDDEPLVRESCVLALDIADYVSSNDQFQYAAVPS
ncbi:Deoxyhypusine hydroxylase [Paragonimus heterotremus]|uniref:Deoxyhypusine hydroxylase n=1 Tax=Paragonimus heterotremus TaxID=100268 RepID=A0A8J4TL22_9TREM|nr:Deoxyhypusine hydroxylase [Paragonimus heterotremus]